MPRTETRVGVRRRFEFSLDTWAVIAAFGVALLVRLGVLRNVRW